MKPIKCDIYIILSFASNFYSDYRDSSHFISSNWIISSKKRRLWRGSRGKRWCSILSRAVVVRMDEPMRSLGWRRVLGWCRRSSYIYIYTCKNISHWSGKSICEVGYFLNLFDLHLTHSIWRWVICNLGKESAGLKAYNGTLTVPNIWHPQKATRATKKKPLTFQYTGYLIIKDPNNGLLKYPHNWVVYGSIISMYPKNNQGPFFSVHTMGFTQSTYPQNP